MLFWTASSDNTASVTNNPISNKKKSSSADERCILTERLQWCGEGYGQGHIPSGTCESSLISPSSSLPLPSSSYLSSSSLPSSSP